MAYSNYVKESQYATFLKKLDDTIEATLKERFEEGDNDDDYDYDDKNAYTNFLDEAFQWEFNAGLNYCWKHLFERNLRDVSIEHYLMLQKEMIDDYGLDDAMISNNAHDPYWIFNIYALNQTHKYEEENYHVKWRYGSYQNQMIKVQSLVRMRQSRIATIRKLHLTGSL